MVSGVYLVSFLLSLVDNPVGESGLRLQGVRGGGCGPACDVARLGHQQASRAAYLLWWHLHVCSAAVPVVRAQDGGECVELPW